MAIVARAERGTLVNGAPATIFTPGSAGSIVTNIVLCNTTNAAATATITIAGVAALSSASIPAYSTVTFDMRQQCDLAEVVAGGASAAGVTYHISGVNL